jgi:hypothetical protein
MNEDKAANGALALCFGIRSIKNARCVRAAN